MADITGTNYRVLALDVTGTFEYRRVRINNGEPETLSNERIAWIESALKNAQKYDKEVLVMINLPLSQYPASFYTDFNRNTYIYIKNGADVQNLLTKYGVRYAFAGHMHLESTLTVETEHGTLTEEYTSSICGYPCYVKNFQIKSDYTFTKTVTTPAKVPAEYLPEDIAEDAVSLVTTDLKAYCKQDYYNCIVNGQQENLLNKYSIPYADVMTGDAEEMADGYPLFLRLFYQLEIYPTGSEESDKALLGLNDQMLEWCYNVDKLSLYGSEGSVQSIVEKYASTIPYVAEYNDFTVVDYIVDLFMRTTDGRFANNDTNAQIYYCIFNAGIYLLKDVDLFGTLHSVNELIYDSDMAEVFESYLQTGTFDLKQNEFVLAVISLFQPYLHNHKLILNFTNSEALLQGFSAFIPFLMVALPEAELFLPGGQTDYDYLSFTKSEVYGEALLKNILLPVLTVTASNI